jgi:YD repeat-containing protein
VHYFKPHNEKQEKKWAESPEKKDFITDKVSMIEAPIGPCGRLLPVARFSYRPGLTEVRDADHILTRYHHDQFRLHLIDYCDEKDRVCSYLKFVWEGSRLKAKTMLGPEAEGLFSRTFQYDQFGNVVEETLWGNLTGNASDSFVFQPDGTLSGAESYRKRYVYLPDFNIPILEEEEEGPTYRYVYKPHSNLLSAKFTCDKEKILFRQFFIYNEDNLLIGEIEDDGCSNDLNDFAYVKERRYKRYDLDPSNGMTRSVTETYWDPASGNERLLKKVEYAYSPQNLVIAEAVYDANGQYRYTVHTDHNAHGHVISKTTPMGQKSTYAYDPFGNLLESKEVGSLKKIYTYNRVSQPLSCEEIDSEGSRRISHSVYDSKGRLLSQTNSRGNATHQRHDAFGKCLETQLPKIKDEQGNAYSPVIRFSYDKLGNIASTTSNGNETTRTTYNTLRKPIRIIQPDGTEISHVYNKKGSLTKTIYPDGTQAHYAYDILQRMTSKMIYSASGELLSQELWSYNAFHLVSHTDPRGLITTYDYDGAGRLISETSGEKQNHFTYDPLGFLTRTTDGNLTQVKIHDEGGRVIEEWIEDLNGRSENHMRFVYDE